MKVEAKIDLYDQEKYVKVQEFSDESEFFKKMIPHSIVFMNAIHWKIVKYDIKMKDKKEECLLVIFLKKYYFNT